MLTVCFFLLRIVFLLKVEQTEHFSRTNSSITIFSKVILLNHIEMAIQ